MVIYSYHVSRKKKISYVLAFNGSSLTLLTLLGLGHDREGSLLYGPNAVDLCVV